MKKKRIANRLKVNYWGEAGEITGLVIIALWRITIFIPLTILKVLYVFLVKVPDRRSVLLGFLRVALMLFVCKEYQPYDKNHETELFFLSCFGISPGQTEIIISWVAGLCAINLIWQLLIAGGLSNSSRLSDFRDKPLPSSGFPSVDVALRYREGVVNMQSTSGKVDEYAKTAFVTADTFRSLSEQSDSMREAIKFLDGKLNMQSTSGKYQMLKELFSGKGGNK